MLSLLLTCTAAQAQRYRLVADTSYSLDGDAWEDDLWNINSYVYKKGNTTNKYDSLYLYTGVNGSRTLGYINVRKYDRKGRLAKEQWFEKFVLKIDFDAKKNGDVVYYKDGALVVIRSDSFVYNSNGSLAAKYIYKTTSDLTSQSDNSSDLIAFPGEYKLYLQKGIQYSYSDGKLINERVQVYNDNGEVVDAQYTTNVYDSKGGKVEEILVDKDNELIRKTYTSYMDKGTVYTTERPDNELYGRIVYKAGMHKTTCATEGRTYKCSCAFWKDGKPERILTSHEDTYNADSLITMTVDTNWYDNTTGEAITKEYTYDSAGNLIAVQHTRSFINNDQVIKELTDKTTYTYEQY